MADPSALVGGKPTTPSLVDPEQVLKATKALVAHIKKAAKEGAQNAPKRNILDVEGDAEGVTVAETSILLTITTKTHMWDSVRLNPSKIILPHPLNTDPEITICLISADPQRAYKDIIASDEFPADLRTRITRVIDLTHLKKKFKEYEAQRKLFAEHDVFLADDRIINRLPKALGKTFYKNTTKRPIEVVLHQKQQKRQMVDSKKLPRKKEKDQVNARSPKQIAAEIEKAIGAALVHLSPATNSAVKVGYAGWTPTQIAANAETVAQVWVDNFVPQKWQNVKSLYIKGPQTIAVPIWQTDELWLGNQVLADDSAELKALEEKKEKANVGRKRKSQGGPKEEERAPPAKKTKLPESNDDADRKAKLKAQKKAAKKAMED